MSSITPPDKGRYGTLTYTDAEQIRQRRFDGEQGLALAAEFGVSPQIVCDIVHHRRHARPDRAHLEAEVEHLRAALVAARDALGDIGYMRTGDPKAFARRAKGKAEEALNAR